MSGQKLPHVLQQNSQGTQPTRLNFHIAIGFGCELWCELTAKMRFCRSMAAQCVYHQPPSTKNTPEERRGFPVVQFPTAELSRVAVCASSAHLTECTKGSASLARLPETRTGAAPGSRSRAVCPSSCARHGGSACTPAPRPGRRPLNNTQGSTVNGGQHSKLGRCPTHVEAESVYSPA